jgi:AcrR family transcriptional regulator
MPVTAPPAETAPTPAALATRAAIMDTADRLFRTLGYQKTTVADIARELRMSPANVYRFFASKAAITEAIAERLLEQVGVAVWAVARGPEPAPDRLRALFRLMQQQTLTLFFSERRMHDIVRVAMDEHWAVVKAHINLIDQAIAHIVRDGQAAGVFGDVDPEQTGGIIHATCVLFSHPTLVQQCLDTEDLPAMADAMAEFCLRALRPD